MKSFLTILSLVLLCGGCDLAARQQAREDARRAEIQKELKAMGEALHRKPDGAPAGDPPAAAEPKNDSAPSSEQPKEMQ